MRRRPPCLDCLFALLNLLPMMVEALLMYRRALTEDHPSVALSLNNLAVLNMEQRRYEEADLMYVEALATRRRALTEGHPDIALSLWHLALIYKAMQQYEKAPPMFEEACAIWLAAHGPEHVDTDTCDALNLQAMETRGNNIDAIMGGLLC